ncbi:hypothetical protein LMG28614_06182 [Paraburkholderia ultramafica]|uniref:Uncharacterized protein n=1 Tax=Paraburkholderia ultramafica TaxID=1544867 RepID=A0A6S7BM33_9BURK|nr:hypothetical protein LMG28614_06182 [Paraburkholderia ultramafica]
MEAQQRDYALASRVSRLEDDVLIGVAEVAAFTGFAEITIRQKRIKGFPAPLTGLNRLRWRVGDIREWLRAGARTQRTEPVVGNPSPRTGRRRMPVVVS